MRRVILIAAAALAVGPSGCAAYTRLMGGGYPAEGSPTPSQIEWMRAEREYEREQEARRVSATPPAGESP